METFSTEGFSAWLDTKQEEATTAETPKVVAAEGSRDLERELKFLMAVYPGMF